MSFTLVVYLCPTRNEGHHCIHCAIKKLLGKDPQHWHTVVVGVDCKMHFINDSERLSRIMS